MKYLLLIASSVLFLYATVLPAQTNSKDNLETKEIFENMKQWHQQVLIDKNLEIVKKFYPTSGGAMLFGDQKIAEWKVDRMINRMSGQFENGKYTSLSVSPIPCTNNNSSNTVLVFSTITFEDQSFKKDIKNELSILLLEIYIKKDGQWVSSTKLAESMDELQLLTQIDKSILY